MLLAADTLNLIGTIFGGVASIMGGYALIKARRTEDKSATREDMRLALETRDKLLDRYESRSLSQDQRITNLETENQRIRAEFDKAMVKADNAEAHQLACEEELRAVRKDLHTAQVKIEALGG